MPLPQDDPKQRKPNIEKATELLGWNPTIPLEQGLVKTIEYFDRYLSKAGVGSMTEREVAVG
jgi:UDP-glucuronate decarboxylase